MQKSNAGTVLILSLWILTLLTLFAVHIGIRIQKKVQLLSHLEKRSRLYFTAESGIRKAIAVFNTEFYVENVSPNLILRKQIRFNNPKQLKDLEIGAGMCDVSYANYDEGIEQPEKMYGMIDEERKINVNTSSRSVLSRLIQNTLKEVQGDDANELAGALIDWREYGESEIKGFYSDDYYRYLEFPYKEKKENYERLDEILLVRGITPDIYERLSNFITVYGSGRVNVNTAPRPVLLAVGLDEVTVTKIMRARRGLDGLEATSDDIIFENYNSFEHLRAALSSEEEQMKNIVNFTEDEMAKLNDLFISHDLGTKSSFFHIQSTATFGNQEKRISCIFDASDDGDVIYWSEQ